jgi:hypothetical protein
MSHSLLFHEGNIALQETYASTAIASKLESRTRTAFSEPDRG